MKLYHVKDKQGNSYTGLMDQLIQLTHLTWDGDLISKQDTRDLVKAGLAKQYHGWSIITLDGLKILSDLKLINP